MGKASRIFDMSKASVPRQKTYKDSTLMTWGKAELIEYIRLLEHNYDIAIQFNENQAHYIEHFCPYYKESE